MTLYTTWLERKKSSQDLETKFCCCLLQSVTIYWQNNSCWQSAQASAEALPQSGGSFWVIISGIKVYETPIVLLVFSRLRTLVLFSVEKRFPWFHDFSSMLQCKCVLMSKRIFKIMWNLYFVMYIWNVLFGCLGCFFSYITIANDGFSRTLRCFW